MKTGHIAVILALAALALSACAEGYGYAYDYDPYLGPRGHYTSAWSHRRTPPGCQHTYYTGPYQDEMKGTYYAGPYCADGQAFAVVAPGSVIP